MVVTVDVSEKQSTVSYRVACLDLLDGISAMLQGNAVVLQIAQVGAERGIGNNIHAAARQILRIVLNGDEV